MSLVTKIVVPIFILFITIILAIVIVNMKAEPEKKEVIVQDFLVDAQPIFAQDIEFLVYAQGVVKPKNSTMLSTQVSGTIVAISEVFNEGGFFRKGDVLVELENDDYATDLLLSEAELAGAQASLDEEIARGRVAQQEWSSVNKGSPPELGLRKPQLAREKANLKAAKAKLERAKRNFSRTKITAPYDGLVKSNLVNLGQFAPMGTQIGEVFSTEVAEIRLPLTDNDVAFIGNLKETQPEVTLSADVAGKRHIWKGRLVRDEAVLDEARRVIYGVVEVQDPYNLLAQRHDSALKFGRFVSAAVSGVTATNIVKLPRFVMRLDGTVLTVNNNDKLQINPVEVVRADEDFVYISSGLPLDHKVVMSAVSRPYEGMPVRFLDDAAPPPSTNENEPDGELSL